MLAGDSPFYRLPYALDPTQAAFLVGVRFCVETIALSYVQLIEDLNEISNHCDCGGGPDSKPIVRAVAHVWSIVDSVHRLCGLLDAMPGVQKRDIFFKKLLRRMRDFTKLRNPIQHLSSQIQSDVRDQRAVPIWGTLAWVRLAQHADEFTSYVLYPGSIQSVKGIPAVNPGGREFHGPLDLIQLHGYDVTVRIGETVRLIEEFVSITEHNLRKDFAGLPHGGTDLVIGISFVANPT